MDSLTFIYSQLLNLKQVFQKCKAHIIITYRNYKNYDNNVFRSEIQSFCSLSETDLGL